MILFKNKTLYNILLYAIAAVWLVNGLFCKILNLVPRHQEIVASILGDTYASPLTITIGFLELGMIVWILSGIKSRINAIFQIVIVVVMNIMEFALVPELLLWGKFNLIFSLIFVSIIYLNEFCIKKNRHTNTL